MAGGVFDSGRFGAGSVECWIINPLLQGVGCDEPCLADLGGGQRANGARPADTGGGYTATSGGLGRGEVVQLRHDLRPDSRIPHSPAP